jgi:hypothetical protein
MALPKWFTRKDMGQYDEFPNCDCGINTSANNVMLCYNMHKALDHFFGAPVLKGWRWQWQRQRRQHW